VTPKKRAKPLTHIKDLVPDPNNRRKHTPRNVGMIVEALHKVGTGRSIVIDENNEVLAGNATIEAAGEAGITDLKVVEAKGSELVAVRRTGLSEAQKRDLALYDNRTGELAEWDVGQLLKDAEDGLDLSPFFYEDELADLLETPEPDGGLTDPDDVPAKRATDIKTGDLFTLGDHRLLCGDCTNADDVALVMNGNKAQMIFTDPPYNVGYQDDASIEQLKKRRRRTDGLVVPNDSLSPESFALFLKSAIAAWPLSSGGSFYVCASGGDRQVVNALETIHEIRQMIVWVKDRMVLSRQDYHWQHESLWYGWKSGKSHYFINDRTQTTVWEIPRPPTSPDHPTTKPNDLMSRAIRNSCVSDDIVFDGFLGSGSTIIAAEQLSRHCYGIEIEPSYCQVTIDRWEAFTGKTATKVT